jgi:hypothetical protein
MDRTTLLLDLIAAFADGVGTDRNSPAATFATQP